ncbi:MAG: metallophosphoesterase family protein [Caldilineaceae bacterium]|nr:metallophosphoesterase family protein [Caldilineaceae bacterium]
MRVLVLSDIHANLVALETVLTTAEGQYDTVWCLGDVVGYGPRPNECVALIREIASVCVMGNHDWAALARPGLDVDEFNPHARQAVLWTRKALSEESIAFLNDLPDVPVQPEEAPHLLLTHASPRQPVYEYILTPSIALENFSVFSEPICLFGHTHKPIIFRWQMHEELHTDPDDPMYAALDEDADSLLGHQITAVDERTATRTVATVDALAPPAGEVIQLEYSEHQRLIINPGSVGQPRDNDARAAYAILDLDKMTWHYNRVPYPIELTQNQMRAAQLPKRLIDRLSFGL